MRLCQEIVLGIGGVRALRGLGIEPAAWHLNEGHSAFMLLERARELVAAEPGLAAEEALRRVGRNSVFTIHTPVKDGNEQFERALASRLLSPWLKACEMPAERLMELGRGLGDEVEPPFDMTAFVLRHAAAANAVSRLHAETANATWASLRPEPIMAITNGVHAATWIGRPIRRLYERATARSLGSDAPGPEAFAKLADVLESDLWGAHRQQKRELIEFTRSRLARQFARHGESPGVLRELHAAFDPETLIIGFARRFATYKRADLLFHDEHRLARLLADSERPVQLVLAGKAHPADRPGQQVIQRIFTLSRTEPLRGRIFILEDYDMRIARFLVGGVDIWLNNPRRPMEASGTSGMKAAMNGIPSISILDGWWDEGYNGRNGWAIGGRETLPDDGEQDEKDAHELYRLLEEEVVPRFYARDGDGVPGDWIATMREAIAAAIWQFSTARMLREYVEKVYRPAARSVEAAAAAT
jgi:starch phosphorylase